MADPYSLLGVSRDADQAAIKKAYRKLAKELHPDRNKDKPDTAARFAEVTQAYDILSDPEQRAKYDSGEIDEQGNPKAPFGFEDFEGHGPFRGRGPFRSAGDSTTWYHFSEGTEGFEDIFSDLFGGSRASGGRRYAPRGSDVLYRVKVNLEDVAKGSSIDLRLQDGGEVSVRLPAGAKTGTRLRLTGKGQDGPGGRGDAIVEIEVRQHKLFKRDGDNIRIELPIRWDEAILGAKVRVPTVDGPVNLSIPKGSTSGKTLRIRGKGMRKADGTRGHQLVRLMIDLPPDDPKLTEWARAWRDTTDYDPRAKLGI